MAGGAVLSLDQDAFAVKTFFGTSENAVESQIWISVSVCVLVAIIKKRLNLSRSLCELLQILSLNLFEKTPLDRALSRIPAASESEQDDKQLILLWKRWDRPELSPESSHQIPCPQMRVPLQHLQRLMSRNGRDLHGVESLLEQPAGRLVVQVVEAEILEQFRVRLLPGLFAFLLVGRPRCGDRALKSLRNRIRPHAPHSTIDAPGEGVENHKRPAGKWHAPGRAGLGFRNQCRWRSKSA